MTERILRLITRNPITKYLSFIRNAAFNYARFPYFEQRYLAQVVGCEIGRFVKVLDRSMVANCRIGRFSYIAADSVVVNTDIGSFCSIGPGCRIGLGNHPSRDFVSTSPVFFSSSEGQVGTTFVHSTSFAEFAPITIGHDVWVGANAAIANGVRIGNGAIIGAGAVVVSDVPDYSIYGGVPARLIRSRFSEAQVEWLGSIRWWEREEAWLRANADRFRDIVALKLFMEQK